jgi:hypothetical protein
LKVIVAKCERAPQTAWLMAHANDAHVQTEALGMSHIVEVSCVAPLSIAASSNVTSTKQTRAPHADLLHFVELLKPLVDFEKLT